VELETGVTGEVGVHLSSFGSLYRGNSVGCCSRDEFGCEGNTCCSLNGWKCCEGALIYFMFFSFRLSPEFHMAGGGCCELRQVMSTLGQSLIPMGEIKPILCHGEWHAGLLSIRSDL
jgi:hypothetical protein